MNQLNLIHAIPALVVLMHNAMMEFVAVLLNSSVIHIKGAGQNAF